MFRIATLLTTTFISAMSFAATAPEAGQYQIDPTHSKVGFEVTHLVISSVEGGFKAFSGTLDIAADMTKSKVKAAVDVDSIDTGVGKRDEHLKSPEFFDTKKYPKMTFESKSITGTPEAFVMEGDLALHGKKKRVKFTGKFLGSVADGYGNQKVAFHATTEINRKDFGLNWNNMVEAGPVVGDMVKIELKLQAGKPVAKAQ